MQGNSFNSWWYLAPSWHFQNELPVKVVWRFLWKMLSVVLLITLKDISCVTCIENTCQRLLRKQIFAKKKRNLWLYSTSFMLMSSLPRIQHLLLPKIGEVGGTPRNTWLTFLLQQNYSFVSTRGRRSVTKSLWTRLLMYCSKSQSWDLSGTCWWRNVGVRSQKEDSSFSLIRSYHCTVYQNTVLFLWKGHRSKIQISAKGNQEERLEKRNQKGHESKCAG